MRNLGCAKTWGPQSTPHLKYYMQIINTQSALPPEDLIGKYRCRQRFGRERRLTPPKGA